MNKEGVLTGCDESHEWMLKLWWNYYSQTNTYPVTFCDFGMSKSARLWCEKRGDIITPKAPNTVPAPKKKVDLSLIQEWKQPIQISFGNRAQSGF